MSSPHITLFHLPNSRSFRIAWLLEELELPYNLVTGSRDENFRARPEFTAQMGGMGKVPTIHDVIEDGEKIVVQESGAIAEYLCTHYSPPNSPHPLLPSSPVAHHAKILEYIHLSEGTLCLQAAPIVIGGRVLASHPNGSAAADVIRQEMTRRLEKALDWLDEELQLQKAIRNDGQGLYLVGTSLTVADVMMETSLRVVFRWVFEGLEKVREEKRWGSIIEWLDCVRDREAWKRAAEKCGSDGT